MSVTLCLCTLHSESTDSKILLLGQFEIYEVIAHAHCSLWKKTINYLIVYNTTNNYNGDMSVMLCLWNLHSECMDSVMRFELYLDTVYVYVYCNVLKLLLLQSVHLISSMLYICIAFYIYRLLNFEPIESLHYVRVSVLIK